jgi:hypothetical protein
MTSETNKKAAAGLSGIASILTLIAVVVLVWLGIRLLLDPVPEENITICPGETFSYEVDLNVNKKDAVTLIKTENFFSENPEKKDNFYFDRGVNREIFAWDSSVPRVIHLSNTVTFPVKNPAGGNMGSGQYRYIVNLNSEGIKGPASLSIPVTIPDSCF